jgi:RAB protein geranylgeranyltransferase component A
MDGWTDGLADGVCRALSRRGWRVLVVDTGRHYGFQGGHASIPASELASALPASRWRIIQRDTDSTLPHSTSSAPSGDWFPVVEGRCVTDADKCRLQHCLVDTRPDLLYADSELVKILASSGVGKYLEFRLLTHLSMQSIQDTQPTLVVIIPSQLSLLTVISCRYPLGRRTSF